MKGLVPILAFLLILCAMALSQGPGAGAAGRLADPGVTLPRRLTQVENKEGIKVDVPVQKQGEMVKDKIILKDPQILAPHAMELLKGAQESTTTGTTGTTTGETTGKPPSQADAGEVSGYLHFSVPSNMALNRSSAITAVYQPQSEDKSTANGKDLVFPVFAGDHMIVPLIACSNLKPAEQTPGYQDAQGATQLNWLWEVTPNQFGDCELWMMLATGTSKDDVRVRSPEQSRVVHVVLSMKQAAQDSLTTQYKWLVGLTVVGLIGLGGGAWGWLKKLKKPKADAGAASPH